MPLTSTTRVDLFSESKEKSVMYRSAQYTYLLFCRIFLWKVVGKVFLLKKGIIRTLVYSFFGKRKMLLKHDLIYPTKSVRTL